MKACADMVDMLDAKMYSLNERILEVSREQNRQRRAVKGEAAGLRRPPNCSAAGWRAETIKWQEDERR